MSNLDMVVEGEKLVAEGEREKMREEKFTLINGERITQRWQWS